MDTSHLLSIYPVLQVCCFCFLVGKETKGKPARENRASPDHHWAETNRGLNDLALNSTARGFFTVHAFV